MRARWLLAFFLFSSLGCTSTTPGGADLSLSGGGDLSSDPDQRGGGGDGGGTADLLYPADGCDTEHACTRWICLAPGEPRGCGICRVPDPKEVCTKDADCQGSGAKDICVSGIAYCLCGGDLVCRPGCQSAADCGEGQVCGAGYRCVGKTCAGDSDCPANLRCSAGKQCERRTCTGSDTCAGSCVKGQCYGTPGTCTPPAA